MTHTPVHPSVLACKPTVPDDIDDLVREYVRFHEVDLRARRLLDDGGRIDAAFRAVLVRVLRGEAPARLDGVPLPDVPEDRPE